MNVIAGVDIDRRYHVSEILDMYHRGLLKPIALNGYVVRADADSMIGFVPWTESTLARTNAGRTVNVDFAEEAEQMRQDVEREHPIVRTSPQAKQRRIAARIAAAPQFAESVVSEVLAESWRRGEAVTGTDIQAAAAKLLANAEVDNKEADSHRVTRAHKT